MSTSAQACFIKEGDIIEDSYGDARRVDGIEAIGRWVVLKDAAGDALIVGIAEKVTVVRG